MRNFRVLPARRERRESGTSVIELSLLFPWIFFLFVGAFDMGFFTYSLIAVENSARVAAEYTSASASVAGDSSGACTKVLAELALLPNMRDVTGCGASPLTVQASSVTGPDGNPATSVSVTYSGNNLVPIPGLLMGQLNVTRNVQMRVKP
jgi:Flp pilus assembly protein TadG